jgi:hypothetical protein
MVPITSERVQQQQQDLEYSRAIGQGMVGMCGARAGQAVRSASQLEMGRRARHDINA